MKLSLPRGAVVIIFSSCAEGSIQNLHLSDRISLSFKYFYSAIIIRRNIFDFSNLLGQSEKCFGKLFPAFKLPHFRFITFKSALRFFLSNPHAKTLILGVIPSDILFVASVKLDARALRSYAAFRLWFVLREDED